MVATSSSVVAQKKSYQKNPPLLMHLRQLTRLHLKKHLDQNRLNRPTKTTKLRHQFRYLERGSITSKTSLWIFHVMNSWLSPAFRVQGNPPSPLISSLPRDSVASWIPCHLTRGNLPVSSKNPMSTASPAYHRPSLLSSVSHGAAASPPPARSLKFTTSCACSTLS